MLPREAKEFAELVKENEPATKDRFIEKVREHERLDEDCITCNIRLLRMTENLVIEDGKASIKPIQCGEKEIHVLDKFRRWKNSSVE